MQQSGFVTFAQRVVACFSLAVFLVSQHKQRLIEKHLLGFKAINRMYFYAFSLVSSVPIKAYNLLPIHH